MKKRHAVFFILLCLPIVGRGQIQNFDSLNGYGAGPDNRLMVVRDRALDDLPATTDSSADLRLRYVTREVDPANERFERDTDGMGARFGLFGGMDYLRFGVDLDYKELTTDYLELDPPGPVGNQGRVETKGYQVGLNLLGHFGEWRLGLQGGYGHADHDATRRSDAGTSMADYDSKEYFAVARVERVFTFESEVSLAPYVAFSTTRVQTDGFTESGSSDSRIVEDFSMRESLGLAGLRVSRDWGNVHPALSVSWVRRLGGGSFEMVSTASDGMERRSGEVEAPYSDLLAVGVSVDFDLDRGWWLRPEAQYLAGGDVSQWTLGLGLGRSF